MPDPEALARQTIDAQLTAAGWLVQDRNHANLAAGPGVAVREFPMPGAGEADYALFAGGKAVGIVEAKRRGETLTGVEGQAANYSAGLPASVPAWSRPLPMVYVATDVERTFTNLLDPDPRSRPTFAFHQPDTLKAWASAAPAHGRAVREPGQTYDGAVDAPTLAGRLQHMPPLPAGNLWPAQRTAITNLEQSLAENRPRALIQMATGSGKTFTAVSSIYRLVRHAGARRVLFLVDRTNLGEQTLKEFQSYKTPDDGRLFTDLYNVQRLTSNRIDPVARVCITTIQRLYSILAGEPDLDPALEQSSQFDPDARYVPPPAARDITYNPEVPIETFDVIFIDECHRSIFNLWSQVLEYFDAYLVGLTATPNKQAFGFFRQNLVMEYTHEQAVADGVNVPFDVYPIRTKITAEGATIPAGYYAKRRDRLTRQARWQELDDDLTYAPAQLDRDVVAEDQIRTVIRTYRDKLPTEIFPGRQNVPKTLVFAKDDAHADDIVRVVREEFAKGNDFCQKITYRTTGATPEQLLSAFRNDFYPRIVVTVDMIATGTDVKPIEVVLFMRSVKSRGYFEQMKGRGVRVMDRDAFGKVVEDGAVKDHFVIVDAVGVTDNPLMDPEPPLERKRSIGFRPLLEQVAFGNREPDTLSSLASRLARLDKHLTPSDRAELATVANGHTLPDLVRGLIDALDPDRHAAAARAIALEAAGLSADTVLDAAGLPVDPALRSLLPDDDTVAARCLAPSTDQIAAARETLFDTAAAPLAGNPDLRNTLITLQQRSEQVIDTVSADEVLQAGFSADATDRARAITAAFEQYIADNRDEITALQILYDRPYAQRLKFADIKALAERIAAPPRAWTPDSLWAAYQQVNRSKVRGSGKRMLTDLVSLVRFATETDPDLAPFADRVADRFAAWLATQETAGRTFTPDQRTWLGLIRDHIAASYRIDPADLDNVPFNQHGGLGRIHDLFGPTYPALLDDLNQALAA